MAASYFSSNGAATLTHEFRLLARLAERAAARAAAFLRQSAPPESASWNAKGHNDWVTHVDEGAEARIRDTLLRAEPSSRLLAEESSPDADDMAGLVWIVDPLDGTTNFLHRIPQWSVSIAAAIDGVPVAAVVYHVPAGEMCAAWQHGGSWIGGNRQRVSAIDDPARALIATGFPFKSVVEIPRYMTQLAHVFPLTSGVRRAGSAALDLTDVARGRFDAFWELTLAPWDVAAGILLIREAGGVVTDLNGNARGIGHGPLVAGNPVMHEWLVRTIDERR